MLAQAARRGNIAAEACLRPSYPRIYAQRPGLQSGFPPHLRNTSVDLLEKLRHAGGFPPI